MDSNQVIKQELDTTSDYYVDVKVEEHPMSVELKQEIDASEDVQDCLRDLKKKEFEHEPNQLVFYKSHRAGQASNMYRKIFKGNYVYCQFCKYSTTIKSDFENHLQMHINLKIQENLCRAKLPWQFSQITHTGEKPYKCNFCDKWFSREDKVIKHQWIHTGDRPYQCSHCEKCFNLKDSLKKHQRTHMDNKLHQCSHCEKCFRHKSSLIKHLRKHTGDKPYQCSYCEKSFHQKVVLVEHMRTHTWDKPYQCCYCEKSFDQKGVLVEHMRTHTGAKPYQCIHCEKSFSHRNSMILHPCVKHTGVKPS